MKVALVILHADTARGGAERYTLDLAAGLVGRGHDVSILASSFQVSPSAGRRVSLNANGITRTGRYLSFLNSLDRELVQTKYDVVHSMLPVRRCDFYHPHAGFAIEAFEAGHRIKPGSWKRSIAWIGNRTNLRRRVFASVERRLLTSNRPPVVFCLSNLICGVAKKYYPNLPDENLVPLFNGIDLKRFDPGDDPQARAAVRVQLGLPDDAVVGLMLAQDFERKGLRQAIEAMARVKNPKAFLVVGGKPDPKEYKKLAQTLHISERIIFAGAISNPADYYRMADFFVLPTFFDPCSLVVLEALAMGLPVISTQRNGACEIMTDGVHGRVLVDPADVDSLTAAINQMQDPQVRRQMAGACLALRPLLSQAAHVPNTERAYQTRTN